MAWALLPFGLLYAVLDVLNRRLTKAKRAVLPTICIGNFTVGGAGKTPVTIALAKLLQAKGKNVAIVSRGFGAKLEQSTRVDLVKHKAVQVGDEPLLLALAAPTFVGPDRHASIELAKAKGADLILLDDGLQHHKLIPDVRVEVRNQADGLGNGFPLPAGPLRQWFGLGLADVRIVVGRDALIQTSLPKGLAAGDKVKAFCGIADPKKFWKTLEVLGLELGHTRAFADHHAFNHDELNELRAMSRPLVTTEKDWVRLPQDLRETVLFIPYAVEFTDPEGLLRAIGQG